MSCCGERRVRMSASTARARASGHAIRVAYVGSNVVRVRGTFSGRRYVFSPDARVHWVDADDSRVMLRTRYFRRVAA